MSSHEGQQKETPQPIEPSSSLVVVIPPKDLPMVRGFRPILKKEIHGIMFSRLVNVIQTGFTISFLTDGQDGATETFITLACSVGFICQFLMLANFFSNTNMNVKKYQFDSDGWGRYKEIIRRYVAPFGVLYNQTSFWVSSYLLLDFLGLDGALLILLASLIAVGGTSATWATNCMKLERPEEKDRACNFLRGVSSVGSTLCQSVPVIAFYTVGFLGAPQTLDKMDRQLTSGKSTLEDAFYYGIIAETGIAGVNFFLSFLDVSVNLLKYKMPLCLVKSKNFAKDYLGYLMFTNIMVLGSLGDFGWLKKFLPKEASIPLAIVLACGSAGKISYNLFISKNTVRQAPHLKSVAEAVVFANRLVGTHGRREVFDAKQEPGAGDVSLV